MKEQDLAFCGLNCNKCPVLIATANNDDMLRQKPQKSGPTSTPRFSVRLEYMT